jgi:hypothetical protein
MENPVNCAENGLSYCLYTPVGEKARSGMHVRLWDALSLLHDS